MNIFWNPDSFGWYFHSSSQILVDQIVYKAVNVCLKEVLENLKIWNLAIIASRSMIVAIVFSVRLRFTASDYPFGIFKLF